MTPPGPTESTRLDMYRIRDSYVESRQLDVDRTIENMGYRILGIVNLTVASGLVPHLHNGESTVFIFDRKSFK